jgi:hypothetical protein
MPPISKLRRSASTRAGRRCRRLGALASVIGVLAAPAAASAHGYYDWTQPGATAPDGTYIVSITYTQTPAPSGGGAGQIVGTFTCVWSDGYIDHCEDIADYF